ncbi:hypothetical protein FRX31_003081 [Thalictrum thalictroides]|uniref:FBD domain-containing protein n=1 Tax=Thalictrum thalictroides TaxID=46969 RepID=A0A7J6XEP6_THATH|nr:hypothetical protein FRX31_003081 [Thalictrum thalictroides]
MLKIRSDQVLRSNNQLCNWMNATTIDKLNLDITCSYALRSELLPDCFFTSGIKMLRLSTKQLLPITMCSAQHIIILKLVDVTFPDADSDGQLILSCPILKVLVMKNCEINHLKTLLVSTPQLEHIKLCIENSSLDCKKNLCCPMLKSLYWRGKYADEISIMNYSALTRVTLKDLGYCCLGFEAQLMFIKCLFENAKVLKRMVVYYSVYVCEKVKEFEDKVFELPRASSDLSISVIPFL